MPPAPTHPIFLAYLSPQDILESKNTTIKDLQYELARVCKV